MGEVSKAHTSILTGAQGTMDRLHRHGEPLHPGLGQPVLLLIRCAPGAMMAVMKLLPTCSGSVTLLKLLVKLSLRLSRTFVVRKLPSR